MLKYFVFLTRRTLHSYDPLEYNKQTDLISSTDSIALLAVYIKNIICKAKPNEDLKNDFLKFLKLSLWANRSVIFQFMSNTSFI